MSSTTDARPEVATYLAAVRETLADLPAGERDDLLAEVESSLIEAAGETGGIAARLGPPDEFAAELRAAAGFEEVARRPPTARTFRASVADAWRTLSASSARGALAELAPLWWAVRGYVAIAFVGVAGAGWSISHPAVPRLVNGKLGLLAIVLAAAFSLWAGRRLRAASGRARLVAVGANLVLLAAAVPVAGHLIHHSEPATILAVYSPPAFQEGG